MKDNTIKRGSLVRRISEEHLNVDWGIEYEVTRKLYGMLYFKGIGGSYPIENFDLIRRGD